MNPPLGFYDPETRHLNLTKTVADTDRERGISHRDRRATYRPDLLPLQLPEKKDRVVVHWKRTK